MNEIYLIRHGETDANKNYIVQGRMDNPLNQEGLNQAKQAGIFLKKNGYCFDLVLSSPLKRAFQTAKGILQAMEVSKPIIVHQHLIERNFGDYDGQKIDEEYVDLIKRGLIPNMETNEVLEKRAFETLRDIVEKYPDRTLLIVTHSHFIKAILVHLIKDFEYQDYLNNCSIHHLKYDGTMFNVTTFNQNPLESVNK